MAQFASDAFTNSDGTVLTAHSANWTKHSLSGAGTQVISNANRLRHGTDAESIYYHSGTPASADYTVSADFYIASATGNNGIAGRMDTAANTFYYIRYNFSSGLWELFRRSAGTFSAVLASYSQTLSAGSTYNCLLSMSGSGATVSIEVKIDGVSRITYSDTDASRITSTGKAGVRENVTGGSNTVLIHLDNFSADDIAAGSSAGPIIKHFRLINGGILMQSRLVIRSILRWLRGGKFA